MEVKSGDPETSLREAHKKASIAYPSLPTDG
jgi:hypothetical protein